MESALRVSRTAAPVREQALSNLRSAILEGRFRPGDRLIERELCALTGVSRTSIREALRQLEAEGLVTNVPNKGPVVTVVTVKEAEDIYQVRALMEGLAGRLFTQRAAPERVAQVAVAVAALAEAVGTGDLRQVRSAKDQFYDALLSGCENEVVSSLLRSLHGRVSLLRALSLSSPGRQPESVAELRRVLSAIQQRDPDGACQACVEHVQNAASVALRALRDQRGE